MRTRDGARTLVVIFSLSELCTAILSPGPAAPSVEKSGGISVTRTGPRAFESFPEPPASPGGVNRYDASFGTLFENVERETHGEVYAVQGKIPPELFGTYFRNGSGHWRVGEAPEETYQSPFDGNGHILAITFENGRAYARNRLVRTSGYLEEKKAGKVLYRGFGVKPGGLLSNAFDMRTKNVANTSVVYWGGRLFSLWEAGSPYELDPKTLETKGLTTLDGAIKGPSNVFSPENAFSAHPRVDPRRGRLVSFGNSIIENKLRIYEFNASLDLVEQKEHKFDKGFHMLHDFALTEEYSIFLDSPLEFDYPRFILGLSSAADSIKAVPPTSPRKSRIILVRRSAASDESAVTEIECDDQEYAFHFANAYDDPETGEVVFDMCKMDYLYFGSMTGKLLWDKPDWAAWPKTYLMRFRVDPVSGRVVEKKKLTDGEKLPLVNTEFPSVARARETLKHRFVYTLNSSYTGGPGAYAVQKVGRIDTETGHGEFYFDEEYKWYSEPQFISKPGAVEEDDGWVLSTVSDGKSRTSELVLFDARDIPQGPICRLQMDVFLPHSLHGHFYPDANLSLQDVADACRTAKWTEIGEKL